MDDRALTRLNSGLFVLTRDRLGLAEALADILRERGNTVAVAEPEVLDSEEDLQQWCRNLQPDQDSIAGIIHLAPAAAEWLPKDTPLEQWRRQLQVNEKVLFTLLHDFSDRMAVDAHVVSVSALGGFFSRQGGPAAGLSLQGGAVGLLKSLLRERPQLRVKAVDLDPDQPAVAMAGMILAELELAGGRQEVGYPGGRRTIFKTVAADPDASRDRTAAPANPVILATGGSKGITAETLRELALPGCTLLVTGRSALEDQEPEALQSLSGFDDLRRYFVGEVRAGRLQLSITQIRQRIKAVLKARELRSNMADFRRRGAVVEYFQVDVTDETAMGKMIDRIYDEYGRIDGVVHGAGVIEDKLLADKDPASWSRVVNTKVMGLLLLYKYLRPQSLKFLFVFSSVAGRYGNTGQTDYATANELMNRLCCQMRRTWGPAVTVKALCWGPWAKTQFGGGMVDGFMEAKFNDRGIALVSAEDGRRLLKGELTAAGDAAVEIICGYGPWEQQETELGRIAMPGVGPESPPSTGSHPKS